MELKIQKVGFIVFVFPRSIGIPMNIFLRMVLYVFCGTIFSKLKQSVEGLLTDSLVEILCNKSLVTLSGTTF